MPRFALQVGGVGIALACVAGLGVAAFGCGSSAPAPVRSATPTARATVTATADPRVGAVEAAVRRYVQALADAMRTGSPTELDSLSVAGSQAAGDAGVEAGIVQNSHIAFVAVTVDVRIRDLQVNVTSATASVDYHFNGYDADWPSLRKRSGTDHTITAHSLLDLALTSDQWLVDRIS